MSELTTADTKAERSEKLFNAITGWAALIVGVLAIHRWALVGGYPWTDRWTQGGLIVAIGLFLTWLWGYWGFIITRIKAWYRAGGLNTAAIAVGLVLCLIVVNTIVRRRFPAKWDLTKNQRYTLSERSVSILKHLQGAMHATVFIPAGRSTSKARDLFNQYKDASDKFTWTHVDPLVDQATLLKMNPKLSPPEFTGAVLEYNGKREDVSDFSEKSVTSSILKLTRDARRKLLFTKGHGEPDIAPGAGASDPSKSISTLLADLRDQQWPMETIDLYAKDTKVPEPSEVAALVIAGPERPLAPEEQKKLTEFLNKGGHVLLALNQRGPNMSGFCAEWGIKTGDDLVLDPTRQGLVVIDAGSDAHQAVKAGKRTVFQPLHSVAKAATVPSGITVTELLKTGSQAMEVAFQPGSKNVDIRSGKTGTYSVASMAEKSLGSGDDKKSARLIVIGDSSFMADTLARIPSVYNEAMASGLINYLGEEEALVSIPPKDENTEQAFLTPDQGRLFALINIWDFPLLALVLAIVVYFKRR